MSDNTTELTHFQQLADHGLVQPEVIDTLTQRMNIKVMTDVQRLTINETLDGTDVYVFMYKIETCIIS